MYVKINVVVDPALTSQPCHKGVRAQWRYSVTPLILRTRQLVETEQVHIVDAKHLKKSSPLRHSFLIAGWVDPRAGRAGLWIGEKYHASSYN